MLMLNKKHAFSVKCVGGLAWVIFFSHLNQDFGGCGSLTYLEVVKNPLFLQMAGFIIQDTLLNTIFYNKIQHLACGKLQQLHCRRQ